MPKRLLKIDHRPQEVESGCLAACTQMALSHLGVFVSQTELNHLFKLSKGGTRYTYIQRVEKYGVRVSLQVGNEANLQQSVNQSIPPVIFVRTGQLTGYWREDVQHAIVLVGYDDTHFYVNDPAFPDSPKQIPIDELMLAWLEFDYTYALISR